MLSKRIAPQSPDKRGLNLNQRNHYNKKLPPFGKNLVARLTTGQPLTNDIFIFIGGSDASQRAKSCWYGGNAALSFHPYDDPKQYKWPVDKQSVLMFDLSLRGLEIKTLKLLALALLDYGAIIVRYVSPDFKITEFKGALYVHSDIH